jgi:hypothetical protein
MLLLYVAHLKGFATAASYPLAFDFVVGAPFLEVADLA